jgi:formamidopyrimidine-DNA glycosylase
MPELPEVETVVRTLLPQVQGRRIGRVDILLAKAMQGEAALFPLLAGSVIDRVYRRAKLALFSLDSSLILAFHLKMTGGLFVHPTGAPPLKHTRIIFDLEDVGSPAGRLFFDDMRTFGFCRVMRPGDLGGWPFWANLGPEPLEGSADDLAGHFAAAFKNRRGAIKAALLDQSVVAGVGNIYADEALFRAGIRPDARADSVSEAALRRFAGNLRDILRLAIRECGSSIRDYRDANGNAGAFQNSFAVYGRKGQPCQSCAQPLQSARVGGRSTVFCERCQR